MGDFVFSWIIISVSLLALFYLYSKMTFFKTLYKTLSYETHELKDMLEEDKIIIELYEFEIDKHLNNVDYLQKQILEVQIYLKEVRNKNTRLRNEANVSNDKIQEMKNRIDALF